MNWVKKHYKTIAYLLIIYTLTASCAVSSASYLEVEVANKESFNLDPEGKNVAIFALLPEQDIDKSDSTALTWIANYVATQYEYDHNLFSHSVGVYTLDKGEFDNIYSSPAETIKEYIKELSNNSFSDILIFLREVKFGRLTYEYDGSVEGDIQYLLPCEIKLFIVDSNANLIHEKELKYVERIENELVQNMSEYDVTKNVATNIGYKIAKELSTKWDKQNLLIIDYLSIDQWHTATNYAHQFNFDKAIALWMPYTQDKEKDNKKRSFAAYNIALCCYLLEEKELAIEWLYFSKSAFNFYEANQLLNYINNSSNK